jgi:hypothetical protein
MSHFPQGTFTSVVEFRYFQDPSPKIIMAKPTKVQLRVAKVLERMAAMAAENNSDAKMFADALDDMLDEIASDDGFGTEQQMDPRGDGRSGRPSMKRVEGVDY